MKVLFLGHSHLKVLNDCYRDDVINNYNPEFVQCGFDQFKPNVKKSLILKKKVLNPNLRKKITTNSFQAVVSCIYGNGHNIMGFFKKHEPYDFVIPGRENLPIDEDCVQVPFEIIKKRIYETLGNFELLIRLINESTSFKVYHLEPPPVIPSNEFIIKHSAERFKTYNNPIINSYICRQKIWFLYSEIMEKICDTNNVYYIKNPASVFDEDKKFQKKYWCETCTHGNLEYGLEILKHVGRIMLSGKSL